MHVPSIPGEPHLQIQGPKCWRDWLWSQIQLITLELARSWPGVIEVMEDVRHSADLPSHLLNCQAMLGARKMTPTLSMLYSSRRGMQNFCTTEPSVSMTVLMFSKSQVSCRSCRPLLRYVSGRDSVLCCRAKATFHSLWLGFCRCDEWLGLSLHSIAVLRAAQTYVNLQADSCHSKLVVQGLL